MAARFARGGSNLSDLAALKGLVAHGRIIFSPGGQVLSSLDKIIQPVVAVG